MSLIRYRWSLVLKISLCKQRTRSELNILRSASAFSVQRNVLWCDPPYLPTMKLSIVNYNVIHLTTLLDLVSTVAPSHRRPSHTTPSAVGRHWPRPPPVMRVTDWLTDASITIGRRRASTVIRDFSWVVLRIKTSASLVTLKYMQIDSHHVRKQT